jgi:hypothetical protein
MDGCLKAAPAPLRRAGQPLEERRNTVIKVPGGQGTGPTMLTQPHTLPVRDGTHTKAMNRAGR